MNNKIYFEGLNNIRQNEILENCKSLDSMQCKLTSLQTSPKAYLDLFKHHRATDVNEVH